MEHWPEEVDYDPEAAEGEKQLDERLLAAIRRTRLQGNNVNNAHTPPSRTGTLNDISKGHNRGQLINIPYSDPPHATAETQQSSDEITDDNAPPAPDTTQDNQAKDTARNENYRSRLRPSFRLIAPRNSRQ